MHSASVLFTPNKIQCTLSYFVVFLLPKIWPIFLNTNEVLNKGSLNMNSTISSWENFKNSNQLSWKFILNIVLWNGHSTPRPETRTWVTWFVGKPTESMGFSSHLTLVLEQIKKWSSTEIKPSHLLQNAFNDTSEGSCTVPATRAALFSRRLVRDPLVLTAYRSEYSHIPFLCWIKNGLNSSNFSRVHFFCGSHVI